MAIFFLTNPCDLADNFNAKYLMGLSPASDGNVIGKGVFVNVAERPKFPPNREAVAVSMRAVAELGPLLLVQNAKTWRCHMAQNHSTTISLTTERQSLTELVQEYTGELRAVAYLMAECESIGPFREDIASLVKHLSHDIDEVLEGVEG